MQSSRFRDYKTLTKPGITKMCVMMAAGGFWLAYASSPLLGHPAVPGPSAELGPLMLRMLMLLLGSALVVGGSGTFNMILERDLDKLMERTASRPLPSGRMSVAQAALFGVGITAAGLALLYFFANPLTAALAAVAWILYVAVYTPLKGRTPLFVLVGTLPGAMPPLMGWTSLTNQVDSVGLALFAIMVVWQLPHFLALSIMCHQDYAKAGIRTVPLVHGESVARAQAFAYSLILLPVSLLLVPLQSAGWLYAVIAFGLSAWMILIALRGLKPSSPPKWANQLFFASLVYLPVLTLALLFDRVLGSLL